jgi:hypothetical protein
VLYFESYMSQSLSSTNLRRGICEKNCIYQLARWPGVVIAVSWVIRKVGESEELESSTWGYRHTNRDQLGLCKGKRARWHL